MRSKSLTLPMFPLSTVVLPGETKMLHVFEDRYKELVSDCLSKAANFGIPYLENDSIAEYGMEVRIAKVLKTFNNGELEIMVQGVAPFKIVKFKDKPRSKSYSVASIEEYEGDMVSARYKMFRSLKKFLKLSKGKEIPVESLTNVPVYDVATKLDLSNEEKLYLISLPALKQKEDFLITKLKLYMHLIKTEKDLNGRFWMN